jgi:tetratricopeptide (TPR) repeat protein
MEEPASDSFFAELKRRKVVRVAIAYLGVVSIMLEVSDNLFEVLILEGLQRVLVIGAATGLPIVLVLSWIFDLTSKGVERTPARATGSDNGAEGFSARFTRQLVVSSAVVVLAMTAVGWRYLPKNRVDFEPNRVAVASFTNDTGDSELDIVGTIVARELGRNLERVEGLVVDPDDQLPGAPGMGSEGTQRSASGGVSPMHALAERTRAGLVLSGSYYHGGDDLVLRAEVYDAQRRERIFTGDPVEADPEDLMAGIAALQEGLFGFMAGLGGGLPIVETSAVLQSSAPPSYSAYKEFVLALEVLRTRPRARPQQLAHVDSAVALDSTFVGALALSALLHATYGDREGAQPNLRRLESMWADLTPLDRAHLDRARARADGDLPAEYRASNTAVELVGTSMSHYLAGEASLKVHRPREARDHLLQFDRERMSHPGVYQTLGRALHEMGSHRTELRLMAELHERHPGSTGVGFLRVPEMGALAAVGRGGEALERLFAFELENAGASTWIISADEIEAHGDAETARVVRERYLERHDAIPQDERQRSYEFDRGRLLASLGRSDEARDIFRGLIDDTPGSAAARVQLALIAATIGDRAYAEETIEWLGQRLRPSQDGSIDQARIAAALGDAERSVRLHRQAEEAGQVDFFGLHRHPAYQPIRDHPVFVEYMKPRG